MSDIKITKELPPLTGTGGILTPGDFRKECCRLGENLEYLHVSEDMGQVVTRCKVCGCRHFEINADPGHLGVRR